MRLLLSLITVGVTILLACVGLGAWDFYRYINAPNKPKHLRERGDQNE